LKHNLFHSSIVSQHSDQYFCGHGSFTRGFGNFSPERSKLFCPVFCPVIDRERVPSLNEVLGHSGPHVSQAYKAYVHPLSPCAQNGYCCCVCCAVIQCTVVLSSRAN